MHVLVFEYQDGQQWPNVSDDGTAITHESEIDALLAMFDNEKYKKSTKTYVVEFDPLTLETLNTETYYPDGRREEL